jgi:hypothetical protein
VVLAGKGNEAYERFEWRKNGELIEGATQSTFTTSEAGEYEIIGYNRKNCPAISNKVQVNLPDYPAVALENPIVGCAPGQPVDLTSQIPGYNPSLFDYQLTGMGLTFLNDELKGITRSGLYELRVKGKSLDCFSEPVSLEVFIQEKELTVDFDFEVQGTGIKDDASGGIFPDDVIQFTDKSDERAVKWEWDFGDGSISTEQNPTHVFGKKGEFEVKLTISDEWGCQESLVKTVSITRSYRFMVPTGFTPTGTENKTFLPKYKGLVQIELLIFNTWGELIFRTDELDTEGWDGTLEGKLLDSGIFVYRFDGVATDGEKVSESGKFRLIR